MLPHDQEKLLTEIFSLYERYGTSRYIGENISQTEHMCQAAELAKQMGYDDEVIMAAFFHDIGHLMEHLVPEHSMEGYGVMEHEKRGADFLRRCGFSKRLIELVESHVKAKRYLTYADKEYYHRLSDASKKTLEYQGGKMTEEEARLFEKDELFALKIQLRNWDEMAKVEHIPLPDLSYYREMASRLLS